MMNGGRHTTGGRMSVFWFFTCWLLDEGSVGAEICKPAVSSWSSIL